MTAMKQGEMDGIAMSELVLSANKPRASVFFHGTDGSVRAADVTVLPGHVGTRADQNAAGKIRTFTNKLVNPWDMQPDDIDIRDIAEHLSNETRYAGAVGFYSVAQHCVLVSEYFDTPEQILAGLLHDAEEAYFKDMPSPIKANPMMEGYRNGARECRKRIFQKFGLGGKYEQLMPAVKVIDELMYFRERRSFDGKFVRNRIVPVAAGVSAAAYLSVFNRWIKEIT
jgi:hypothetical protein